MKEPPGASRTSAPGLRAPAGARGISGRAGTPIMSACTGAPIPAPTAMHGAFTTVSNAPAPAA
jgi:hypothetical protein